MNSLSVFLEKITALQSLSASQQPSWLMAGGVQSDELQAAVEKLIVSFREDDESKVRTAQKLVEGALLSRHALGYISDGDLDGHLERLYNIDFTKG